MTSSKNQVQKNKTVVNATKWLLCLLFIGLFGWYCYDNPGVLESLYEIPIGILITATCLYIPFFMINGFVLKLGVAPYLKNSDLWVLTGITLIGSLFNYVTPLRAGSIGARAIYLKSFYQVSYTDSTCVYIIVSLGVIIASIGAVFYCSSEGGWGVFFALSWLFSSALCVWGLKRLRVRKEVSHDSRAARLIASVFHSLNANDVSTLFKIVSLLFLQILINATIFFELFKGVGDSVSYSFCVLLAAFGNLTLLVSITPSNLGFKEMTLLGIGGLHGVDAEQLIAVLLLDRLIQFCFVLVTGSASLLYLKNPQARV